jgi:glycosyltransferase 2 family protein
MTKPFENNQPRKKFSVLGIIFAVLGLALFVYFVNQAHPDQILAGIRRLGFGFVLIIAISSIRQTVRSLAWTKCFEAPYRLRFIDAFQARLMGDALGNVIPLASVAVSEPSKAVFVRDRVPLIAALAALALENIFYSLSVILVIVSGTTALLLSFSLPKPLRIASMIALIVAALVAPLGYFVIHKQWRFISGLLSRLHRRGFARAKLEKAIPRAEMLEDRIYGFYSRHRGRLLPIFLLELCFHGAGVLEIYVTLSFISDVVAPTILTAFILESVNRVINVTFKFVPLRTGVDEAGTGMLSKVLGFSTAIGVTLAIVRKARDIFWTTVGMGLIVRKGLSLRSLTSGAAKITNEIPSGSGAD